MKDMKNLCYRFDEVEIDVQNLRVTVGSEIRPLEPKSFRLLLFMVENPGRILPKEEIMAVVWPNTFVSDNSLARAITQIRKALDDDPKAPRFVETVPSVGYRFLADGKEIKESEGPIPVPVAEQIAAEQAASEAAEAPADNPRANRKQRFPAQPWFATASVAILLAVLAAVYFRGSFAPAGPEMRLEIGTPSTNDPRSFALSPDGRQLAYVASGDVPSRLWLRRLDSTTAQPLAVIEGGAAYPFWSPDSRSVGFFSGGKLKRVDIVSGNVETVADALSGRGGTWSTNGVILFAPSPASPLFRVSDSGGEAVPVTRLGKSGSHRFPQFLSDGRRFLFYVEGAAGLVQGAIYLGSLDSGDPKRLTAADTAGAYMPPGWLLWVRAGTLVAERFSLDRGELSGDPITVADSVFFDTSHARLFSASATGLVAYRRGTPTLQLTWFDRSGKALGNVGTPADNNGYAWSNPRISPDGRRVAVHRRVNSNMDIWISDGSHADRFTFAGGDSGQPVWSPDGSRIAFKAYRNGIGRIYVKRSDLTGTETALSDLPKQGDGYVTDWSPDGNFLLYHTSNLRTGYDLWTLPLGADRKPWLFLQSRFDEKSGRFSPDGRWVAYMSNESGRSEIYVRAFAELGGEWQVSTEGGNFPAWRRDGKELYFVAPDSRIMAVPIMVTGKTLQPGTPEALFPTRIYGGGLDVNTGGSQFDVSADGRFLVNTILDTTFLPITILQNWNGK